MPPYLLVDVRVIRASLCSSRPLHRTICSVFCSDDGDADKYFRPFHLACEIKGGKMRALALDYIEKMIGECVYGEQFRCSAPPHIGCNDIRSTRQFHPSSIPATMHEICSIWLPPGNDACTSGGFRTILGGYYHGSCLCLQR